MGKSVSGFCLYVDLYDTAKSRKNVFKSLKKNKSKKIKYIYNCFVYIGCSVIVH